jgi:hypothetical protein
MRPRSYLAAGLRELPERERGSFLNQYGEALDGARDQVV